MSLDLSADLVDSVELERRVADLNKELSASRDVEGALRVQLEELASFRALPDKVDNLMKQVSAPLLLRTCQIDTKLRFPQVSILCVSGV